MLQDISVNYVASHLQCTTMGPASGGLQAFTRLRKARNGVGCSGTPWSGQAVNWNCLTSLFSLEPFWKNKQSWVTLLTLQNSSQSQTCKNSNPYLKKCKRPDAVRGQFYCVQQCYLDETVRLCTSCGPVLITFYLQHTQISVNHFIIKYINTKLWSGTGMIDLKEKKTVFTNVYFFFSSVFFFSCKTLWFTFWCNGARQID